jgi:hypothetical protein
MFGDEVDPAGGFADYYLRFGVGFADGRKATNLEGAVGAARDSDPGRSAARGGERAGANHGAYGCRAGDKEPY